MTDPLLSAGLAIFAIMLTIELFDRTNFALIALSAKQPPFPTWVGSVGGFAVVTALAVLIGAALLAALGGNVAYVRIAGGVFLLGYAVYFALHEEKEESAVSTTPRSAFVTGFVTIFLLELGDTTMIFAIIFAGSTGNPLLVFVAGTLALATVAALGCFIGSRLANRLPQKHLKAIIVTILLIVAVLTILYGVFPQAFPTL